MNRAIEKIVSDIRRKNALLWVCQRYDLNTGEDKHDNSLPANQAIIKYRNEINKNDRKLSQIYWEGIWIESAKSNLTDSIFELYKTDKEKIRKPVLLSTQDDAFVDFSSTNFLPISILPGLIDNNLPKSGQYGSAKARVRDRISFSLCERLKKYKGRSIIVIGASNEDDLELLFEITEDINLFDLNIYIISDSLKKLQHLPKNPSVAINIINISIESFIESVFDQKTPTAFEVSEQCILCDKTTVNISGAVYEKITQSFHVVTSQDIEAVEHFDLDDFYDFLDGDFSNWKAYSINLPAKREYKPDGKLYLADFIINLLKILDKADPDVRNTHVKFPCDGGAGSSTLLRSVAFKVASAGYPVLYASTEQVKCDYEAIVSFYQHLSEQCKIIKEDFSIPTLIIFDKTSDFLSVRGLTQLLRTHGRKAIVLEVVPSDEVDTNEYINKHSFYKLLTLTCELHENEVKSCAENFNKIISEWGLPIDVPSERDWSDFSNKSEWIHEKRSHFWVAIRYFLTEGLDIFLGEIAYDALGKWILRRYQAIESADVKRTIKMVAILSSYKIICPMHTLLKYLTGGNFSTDFSDTLKLLQDLVVWGNYSNELDDYSIYFNHPVLADELLRQLDLKTNVDKANALKEFMQIFSPGSKGDVWLSRSLAVNVFALKRDKGERFIPLTDREWRLDAFEALPKELVENDIAILHHWSRCLYQSAHAKDKEELDSSIRNTRFIEAIDKLKKAISLPRLHTRDDHPSLLYNTLGTLYSRYAIFLSDESSDQATVDNYWKLAYESFENALNYSHNQDITALITYAFRLIDRHKKHAYVSSESDKTRDLNDALHYLDLAEEVIDISGGHSYEYSTDIESMRTDIFNIFGNYNVTAAISDLKSQNLELGFFLDARLESEKNNATSNENAIRILDTALDLKVNVRYKFALLYLRLMNKDLKLIFNYKKQILMYNILENDPDYSMRPIDMFRRAVLSYQVNEFDEGRERFRKLRSFVRRSDFPPIQARDYWKDSNDPTTPRQTYIKISKVLSDWRAEGYVDEIAQTVPLRPRHFNPLPVARAIIDCIIRFEVNGPLAVPPRFYK